MKKLLITLVFLLGTLSSFAQLEPECNNVLGQAFPLTGTNTCTAYPLNPAVTVNGTPVTRCFSYQYDGPVNLSYLLITAQCGPFALYNTLSFTIYNQNCDTLIVSGSILPTPTNTFIDYLTPYAWYNFCYTWIPTCTPQTDACPIIYSSLLPIELYEFYSESHENHNILRWSTQSEINNDYFVLEKSNDASEWEEIYRCNGAGNSSQINKYQFIDDNLTNTVNYYRLKQVDFDGRYSYSNIILVNSTSTDKFLIYPNPSKNILNVFALSHKSKTFTVVIEDIAGRILYERTINTATDGNDLKINVFNFQKGIYLVKIKNNDYTQETYKFLKN